MLQNEGILFWGIPFLLIGEFGCNHRTHLCVRTASQFVSCCPLWALLIRKFRTLWAIKKNIFQKKCWSISGNANECVELECAMRYVNFREYTDLMVKSRRDTNVRSKIAAEFCRWILLVQLSRPATWKVTIVKNMKRAWIIISTSCASMPRSTLACHLSNVWCECIYLTKFLCTFEERGHFGRGLCPT